MKKIFLLLFLSSLCFAQNECPSGTRPADILSGTDSSGVIHRNFCINNSTGLGSLPFSNISSVNSASIQFQASLNIQCGSTGAALMPLGTTVIGQTVVPSGCTLTCIAKGQCTLTLAAGQNKDFITTIGNNVTLEKLVIDGNRGSNSSSNCVIDTGGNSFKISDSTVQNCGRNGIAVEGIVNDVRVQSNLVQHLNGSGILLGNTPASQGGVDTCITDFHVTGNTVADTPNGSTDGIFVIGTIGSTPCTGNGEVSGNIIVPPVSDTAIEIGEGSQHVTVTGNQVNLSHSTTNGKTAFAVRSSQHITVTGNDAFCDSTSTQKQSGFFIWNGGGVDPVSTGSINVTGNSATGCTSTPGGTNYEANGTVDSVFFQDNFSDVGSSGYTISAAATNTWAGSPMVLGSQCPNTAASSTTIAIPGFGTSYNVSNCTTADTAANDFVLPAGGFIRELRVLAGTGGVNASSGVVHVVTGSCTVLTCTLGTGTSCSDTTHFCQVAAGARLAFTVDTQAAETLANIRVSVLLYAPK